jgi:hypothetical protein
LNNIYYDENQRKTKNKQSSNGITFKCCCQHIYCPWPCHALPTEDIEKMTSISNNPLIQDTEMLNAETSSGVDARGALVQYKMARSIEETTRAVSEIRPIATKRAYEPKIKEFENWAKETFVHEPLEQRTILTGDKLNYFMRTKVCSFIKRPNNTCL